MEIVWCLARDDTDDDKTRAAAGQAADLVLVELVLCLIAQSASVMYRLVRLSYILEGSECYSQPNMPYLRCAL